MHVRLGYDSYHMLNAKIMWYTCMYRFIHIISSSQFLASKYAIFYVSLYVFNGCPSVN